MTNIPFTTEELRLTQVILHKMKGDAEYIHTYKKNLENGVPIIVFNTIDPLNENSKRQKLLLELEQLLIKYGVREFMYSRKI